MTAHLAVLAAAWHDASPAEVVSLIFMLIACLLILGSGVIAWWRAYVDGAEWTQEGGRPRW
jgi:hypothetical protein